MTSFDNNDPRPFRDIARPPPASDTVQPCLIVGGAVVVTLVGLDALAQEILERANGRKIELKPVAFAHTSAIGAGVSAWAIGPAGRDWLGTAAGRGVNVAALSERLWPRAAQREAA